MKGNTVPTVPTGAAAPIALPPAAGGVDVAAAITSVVPGIRILKKRSVVTAVPTTGGQVKLDLPKSSYWQKGVIRITGSVRIVQGAAAQTITATDPRSFIQRIEFALSGSTNPRVLTGLQHDIIDGMDVPAIAPNASTYSVATGANSSTTDYPFVQEFSPRFTVTDQNLYGIPYLGADGTVPTLTLTFGSPDGTLATKAAAGPTITFETGKVELEMWRVDLPGPVAPQAVNMGGETHMTAGQGLYHEASYILLTRMIDAVDLTAAGSVKKFRLPLGPDYLRIILLCYKNGALDDETAPLLDRAELEVQQTTALETKYIWQFDSEYRQTYNKARPKGVYVFSGVDRTGTDSDLYVTRELGNFDVNVYGHATNVPPANSRVECVVQELLPLSSPGQYL